MPRSRAGANDMLMGGGGGAINPHLPDELAHTSELSLHVRQHPVPGPILPPAIQAVRARLPGPVALRQVPPRRAGPQLPQDPIDDPAMIPPLPASTPMTAGQQRRAHPPRFLPQFSASN